MVSKIIFTAVAVRTYETSFVVSRLVIDAWLVDVDVVVDAVDVVEDDDDLLMTDSE